MAVPSHVATGSDSGIIHGISLDANLFTDMEAYWSEKIESTCTEEPWLIENNAKNNAVPKDPFDSIVFEYHY